MKLREAFHVFRIAIWLVHFFAITEASRCEVVVSEDVPNQAERSRLPIEFVVKVAMLESDKDTQDAIAQITVTIINFSDDYMFVRCDPGILRPLSLSWRNNDETHPTYYIFQPDVWIRQVQRPRYALLTWRAVQHGDQLFLRSDSYVSVSTKVPVPRHTGSELSLNMSVVIEFAPIGQAQIVADQMNNDYPVLIKEQQDHSERDEGIEAQLPRKHDSTGVHE